MGERHPRHTLQYYDLAIIGGGINGTGIARDAAGRGLSVLLVEQNFRFAQTVADRHYVMEHGRVVDMVANEDLNASLDRLHQYLGV